ncbi:MAG TPA: hypothetical protein VH640_21855, partial [Bryobacteraceae bacterium]
GYENGHYGVSMKIGEHALLPKVRGTPADHLVIASGFSCREQIVQGARRQALHLSEVLAMALHQGTPNASVANQRARIGWKPLAAAAAATAVTFAATALIRRR